ncbi:MAG TPA: cyclic nucleotide-binding domain-containing protein [Gemmataceae bacterium]|jgi:CRP-like cAMP-binding protein|nr:cyclic nucleotide-binding domain-containing protein [Gemmataceae bacterium]
MSESSLIETLRGIAFLDGATQPDLERIAGVAQLEQYPIGSTLFRDNESLDCIFLIVAGSVALEIPGPDQAVKRTYTVGPGELLGWSPLLSKLPMTATARSLTLTRVVALNAGKVLALCEQDPRFGYAFMRRTAQALARRLDATRAQLVDQYR